MTLESFTKLLRDAGIEPAAADLAAAYAAACRLAEQAAKLKETQQ